MQMIIMSSNVGKMCSIFFRRSLGIIFDSVDLAAPGGINYTIENDAIKITNNTQYGISLHSIIL